MRGEHVVGLATEEQVIRLRHRLDGDLLHHCFPVRAGPAALREAVGRVFFGAGRALHDAVQREEGQDGQLAHSRRSPVASASARARLRAG